MAITLKEIKNRNGIVVTDYRDLVKELKKIENDLPKALRKEVKQITKPVAKAIKSSIPATSPTSGIHRRHPQNTISGFTPAVVPGRLTWGANAQNGNIQPRTVRFAYRPSRRRRYGGFTTLASLEIPNAAVVMADMAGKTNKYTNKRPVTRQYAYSRSATGKRRHRINGQGIAMIRALKRNPSRYVYPAAEQAMPAAKEQARKVVGGYLDIVNQHLRTR